MDWQEKNNFLEKTFSFKTFLQAIEFVNKVAEVAEQINHHPDIYVHNYNQVRIQTNTHSEGKVTQKDYVLTEKIDLL